MGRQVGIGWVGGIKYGRLALIVLQLFVINTSLGIEILFPMTCICQLRHRIPLYTNTDTVNQKNPSPKVVLRSNFY